MGDTPIDELYALLAGLPDDPAAYNVWRRQHVTNRWRTGEAPPAHLIVRDRADDSAYQLLDISTQYRTALVLRVGTVRSRVRRRRRVTTVTVDSADDLKAAKPTSRPLHDAGQPALTWLASRGNTIFANVTERLGDALQAPFYNPTVQVRSDPRRVVALSGDTSDPALVLSSWTQQASSSVVDDAVPLLVHSVTDDIQAGSGAILTEIGGVQDKYLRDLRLDRLNAAVARSKFDVLTRWELGTQTLEPGPLSFDPLFEPYMLTRGAEALLPVYGTKLDALRVASVGDAAALMTVRGSTAPLSARINVRTTAGGVRLSTNVLEFRGQAMLPTDISVVWQSPTPITDLAAFSRPAYASLVWAYWSGQVDDPALAEAVLRQRLGLRLADFQPPSPALRAAVRELVPVRAEPAAPAPEEPVKPPEPVVPGAPEAPTSVDVVGSSTRFLRKGETLRTEKELAETLDQLVVEFLEPAAPNPRVVSRLVAQEVPLRRANVVRYPDLPFDEYYGVWYRSRGMGYFPRRSTVAVPLSAYDTPPSILVRLHGAIRITADATSSIFSYDLRDAKLDDAFDVVFTLAGDRHFVLGFARDKPGLAALETVSVGKGL